MPDRQTIVQALPDGAIQRGSELLAAKAAAANVSTIVVDFPLPGDPERPAKMAALSNAIRPLTAESRLYVRGHGSWQSQTVGGVDAQTWAKTLLDAGLPRVRLISIGACQAGRDLGTSDACRILNSADSFASKFHAFLREMAQYELIVYARIYAVRVRSGTQGGASIGQKHTGGPEIGSENKRPKSKLRFSWNGGRQRREWVDYATGGTLDIDDDLPGGGV